MPARKHVAPELIAKGKYLYEETLTPTDEIGAMMDLSRSAFYLRVKEWGWTQRRYSRRGAALAAAVSAAATGEPVVAQETVEKLPAEPPLAFAARLQRVIDGEMSVIERTLKVLGPATSAEAERTTRVLATISRTVQEIVATAQGQTSAHDADDDPVPRDIDDFRLELAQRIRRFIEGRRLSAVRVSGEPETPLG